MAELTHLGLAAAIPACGLAAIWLLRTPPARAGRRRLPPDLSRRLLRAVAALGAIGLLTRWPVAAVAAAVAAWFLPEVLGTGTGARDEIVKTEAVAAWTEMLRDTLAGPSALDGAIEATAPLAPEPIRPQVAALAARLARQPAPHALARFSHDVDHPAAELVAVSLSRAYECASPQLGTLLSTLAELARAEASMRIRLDRARARFRTSVRVIVGSMFVVAGALVAWAGPLLEPYRTVQGQLVLALVAVMWSLGLLWLTQLARIRTPARFLGEPS